MVEVQVVKDRPGKMLTRMRVLAAVTSVDAEFAWLVAAPGHLEEPSYYCK
jgi:hypothetical protein